MNLSQTHQPEFSLIIPVYHGGQFLRALLQSLDTLDYPFNQYEVIIAGRNDDTTSRELVEAQTACSPVNLFYVSCSASGKAARLNAACSTAKGRYLFFVDDDCTLLPESLNNLQAVIQNEIGFGAIGGSDKLAESDSVFELALDCVLHSLVGTGGLREKTGVRLGKYYPKLWNMAVAKDVLLLVSKGQQNGRLQFFNESLAVYEDVDLIQRIEKTGKKIIYAPQVSVKHNRNTNLVSFVKRNVTSVRIAKKLGLHVYQHRLLGIFVLWLTLGAVLSMYFSGIRLIYLCTWVVYLVLIIIPALTGGLKLKRWQVVFFVPLLLFTLHFSRGLAYLTLRTTKGNKK